VLCVSDPGRRGQFGERRASASCATRVKERKRTGRIRHRFRDEESEAPWRRAIASRWRTRDWCVSEILTDTLARRTRRGHADARMCTFLILQEDKPGGAGSVRVTDIDSSVSGMPASESNAMCSAMVLSAELGDACVSRA